MLKLEGEFYEFGPYRLDIGERRLSRDGEAVPLTPKAFETLVALIRKNGKVVGKEELIREVWPDSFVEDSSLSQHIYLLRKTLGEGSDGRPYIETVPRLGYRFIAEVREVCEAAEVSVSTQQNGAETTVEEEAATDEKAEANADEIPHAAISHDQTTAAPRRLGLSGRLAVFGALAASLILFTSLWLWHVRQRADAAAEIKSVAVLPFKPLGANSNDEHLGLGMADAVITKLSNLRQLTVLPTSSIFKYAGREHDPVAAGRELGVQAVVDGTVQHIEGRIRITVRLIRVADGQPVWSGKFDEQFTSILDVQDSMSDKIAQALVSKTSRAEGTQLAALGTNSIEAHQAYVRGVFFWNKRTPEALDRSVGCFQEAIDKDPDYAAAHAGLADAYALLGYWFNSLPREEARAKATDSALRALTINPRSSEAHTALGYIKATFDRDPLEAESLYQRAIALNPNSATAYHRYATFLFYKGDIKGALEKIQRAYELDPLSIAIGMFFGHTLYLHREYERAAAVCRRAVEMEPENVAAHTVLGNIYLQRGMHREAIEESQKALALAADEPITLGALGYAYAASGQRAKAQQVLSRLKRLAPANHLASFSVALIHTGLGEHDEAIKWFDRYCASDEPHDIGSLKFDPRLDALRSDSEFIVLLQRHQYS
jgi:DNA-binding winged helix-turn-helix (wHTH) protein/TolB-like protein/Flp pilus assembly protein TadD